MKYTLKQIAFKFASSKPGGWMTWFILRYFPFLIPFKKLYQDSFLIAIPHPVPSYPVHILLLPRIYLPDFLALDVQSESGNNYTQSVQKALNVLLADMEQTKMQLVINGGDYQDMKLLHMHLIEHNHREKISKITETVFGFASLESLFGQAWKHIQKTKYATYRLIFLFKKEKTIQCYLQTMPPSHGVL